MLQKITKEQRLVFSPPPPIQHIQTWVFQTLVLSNRGRILPYPCSTTLFWHIEAPVPVRLEAVR